MFDKCHGNITDELPIQHKTSHRFWCNVFMLSFKERNLLVLMHDQQNTVR